MSKFRGEGEEEALGSPKLLVAREMGRKERKVRSLGHREFDNP